MMRSISVRAVLVCCLLAGATAVGAAQTYTPPPPPLTTLPPCPIDKDAKKRAKRKDCDPTVYPSKTVETKGKKTSDASPAVVSPADGSAAQKFPFPEEQPAASTPAAKAFPYPGEAPAEAPHDPAAAAKSADTPAGKAYPYPGEKTTDVPHDPAAEKKAAETPAGKAYPFPGGSTPDMPSDAIAPSSKPDETPSGSSSSESGSSSSSSSDDAPLGNSSRGSSNSAGKNPDDDDEDQPKLKDKGSEGHRSKKVTKPQTDTERVDEDLSVAKFYGQSGNNMGAYLRAKDAVKTQPEFPEGHFVLGEAAKRLSKKDEAAAEFQTYLKLSPDGQQAKAAEKALEELR